MPRACTVCDHPNRDSIDEAIVSGESIRGIARRYNLSKDSVYRHSLNHVPQTIRKAHVVQESARAGELLGRVERLISEAEGLLEYGKTGEKAQAWAAGIGELRRCLELLARVTGELDERPQITLAMVPEWVEVRTLILSAVDENPEIRGRIIDAIGSLTA